jgi:hypothetical protein
LEPESPPESQEPELLPPEFHEPELLPPEFHDPELLPPKSQLPELLPEFQPLELLSEDQVLPPEPQFHNPPPGVPPPSSEPNGLTAPRQQDIMIKMVPATNQGTALRTRISASFFILNHYTNNCRDGFKFT